MFVNHSIHYSVYSVFTLVSYISPEGSDSLDALGNFYGISPASQ